VTDRGTVIISQRGRAVKLGLSSTRNFETDPDISIPIGKGLQRRIAETLLSILGDPDSED
jgi:hypothetical protein